MSENPSYWRSDRNALRSLENPQRRFLVVEPSDPHAIKRLVFVESEIEVIGATRPAHFITRGTCTSCHHFLKSSNDMPSGRFRLPNTLWCLPIAFFTCWKWLGRR